jgi:hypothetical protein
MYIHVYIHSILILTFDFVLYFHPTKSSPSVNFCILIRISNYVFLAIAKIT